MAMKGKAIAGQVEDLSGGYVSLLCAVTLAAIQDARKAVPAQPDSALIYLNSPTIRELHVLAGVELPAGRWDRQTVRRFSPHAAYRERA